MRSFRAGSFVVLRIGGRVRGIQFASATAQKDGQMKEKKKAMLELATGFGQGARYPWSTDAATYGQDFLSERLNAGTKNYWDPPIRAAALAIAKHLGKKASDFAAAGGANPIVIEEDHVALALSPPWIRQGDCPFD